MIAKFRFTDGTFMMIPNVRKIKDVGRDYEVTTRDGVRWVGKVGESYYTGLGNKTKVFKPGCECAYFEYATGKLICEEDKEITPRDVYMLQEVF